MLNALGKAIGQLADPRLRRPIWLTLATSLAVVVALGVASWLLLAGLSLIGIGWVDAAIDLLAGAGVLGVAWLLFPATIAVVAGFLLDQVAPAVGGRYYS